MYFTVYKSSAGSGKTFTLVKEYIRLVLTDPGKFRHILAITFTNKAANEMKQRILQTLKEIAEPDLYPGSASVKIMLPEITATSEMPGDVLSENAKTVITKILHNYSEFAVSTIDSFMHRVIKSFAFDLHIPMDFEVEMEERDLLRKIVDALISRAGTEEQITKFLVEFTRSKADDEKNWNIELDLFNVAGMLLKEDSKPYIDQLKKLSLADFTAIIKFLQQWVTKFETRVKKIGQQMLDLINSRGIPHTVFFYGNQGIAKYFENMANGDLDKAEPNTRVKKTVEEDRWTSGSADADDIAAIDDIKDQLTAGYEEIQTLFEKELERYVLFSGILDNIYPLAILNEIDNMLSAYKKENSILLISEFNRRIADIVLSEPVPFIYERVGEKYHHFLIDEFQDTSVLQWQNLLPLVENALSVNRFSMIVGDGKQAIYRFRSGEVEQFIKLPEIFGHDDDPVVKQREAALKRNYNPKMLGHNYRSRSEIIDFNNRFFAVVRQNLADKYASVYEDVSQAAGSRKQGGYVQLEFYDKVENELSFEAFNLERIVEHIRDAVTRGYRLQDIAILCRSNENASIVARWLLENGIHVISAESLLLKTSGKVNLVIAVISIMLNAEDAISKTKIVHWLSENLRSPSFHETLRQAGMFQKEAGMIRIDFISFLKQQGMEVNPLKLLSLPLYEMCEEIIRIFGLHEEADPYLQFFLDAVLDLSGDHSVDAMGLIDWWEKTGANQSIRVPEGVNAVSIMTIHKAKGLEFPVVIYPFANDQVKKTRSALWVNLPEAEIPDLPVGLISTSKKMEKTVFGEIVKQEADKSLLDLVNLLYVVMTRPTDELYILTQMPPAKQQGMPSLPVMFSQFLSTADLWDPSEGLYSFGNKLTRIKDKQSELTGYTLKSWISSAWGNRLRTSFQAPEHWNVDDPDERKKWGTLIHRILSEIETTEDIDRIVDNYRSQAIITREEQMLIKNEVKAFLSDPKVAVYFAHSRKAKSESEIILPDGRLYRPDRIMLEENSTIVIDFKTGSFLKSHEEQVKQYIDVLEQMSYPNVTGVLLYLYGEVKVRPVS